MINKKCPDWTKKSIQLYTRQLIQWRRSEPAPPTAPSSQNHRSSNESTDGLKGGWSCVLFGVVTMVAVVTWLVTSPTTAGCSVV